MTTVRKVARVYRRDATQHLGKAISFIEAAEAELEAGRADAAALCAIHAAIAAADSVTVALAGQRSTDPDHQRAVTLLRSVASASVEIGRKADQLLASSARRTKSSTRLVVLGSVRHVALLRTRGGWSIGQDPS